MSARSKRSRGNEDGVWRLYGEKWFCSHADADVALMLARPEGAPAGTRGLALFALPRRLRDGRAQRLSHRAAEGQARHPLDGQRRDPAGGRRGLSGRPAATPGLKQMMEQVNLSRLSHGVRAAAMMRRCVNEALAAARGRIAVRPDGRRLSR